MPKIKLAHSSHYSPSKEKSDENTAEEGDAAQLLVRSRLGKIILSSIHGRGVEISPFAIQDYFKDRPFLFQYLHQTELLRIISQPSIPKEHEVPQYSPQMPGFEV